ncbi:MAG TPA: recombinase family protein [Devosia sp.]|jgi:DNA invertase Pin-like site-specific DNA recombinase|uniref:recombinase family protein n=1 Tax=Devosia sp. TaxID=1871048 RepID=UPI002DDCE201|nr:recombinase family protein [Devosia sp.]HEV2515809.1 recombinase family protein [Devosia sp.]
MRESPPNKPLRCAIYTRKSSEEGLEQDFNSLEAQREACEAYIKSQAHEGWVLVPDHFDDGGFSGGNTDRPGLTRLMDKVRAREIDVIVFYKIDRFSRNITDFGQLAETLEQYGVSFVSVTQSFNTKDSMGRLMLNVLLSFAQFERELTGERIRDKVAASKKRGMWMGGPIPLGYDVRDKALVINEAEAATIRKIFELYLDLGSVRLVEEELRTLGLTTKSYVAKSGRQMGGLNFTRGHLYKILGNALYAGAVSHKGKKHKGLHQPIIDRPTWNRVQQLLRLNRQGERKRVNAKHPSLLSGLVVDEFGNRLTSTHTVKDGRRYRYYASTASAARGAHNRPTSSYRLAATEIEPVVIDAIVCLFADQPRLMTALGLTAATPNEVSTALDLGQALSVELQHGLPTQQRALLEQLVDKVQISKDRLRIELNPTELRWRLLGDDTVMHEPIVLEVPMDAVRHGVETRLVVEAPHRTTDRRTNDNALIRAVACGRAWFEELASGKAASFREIAERAGVTDRYVRRVVNLAFLAPDVVEAVLRGEQPAGMSVKALTVDGDVPVVWASVR